MRPLTVVAVFALIAYAGAWDHIFRRIACYDVNYGERLEQQMPLSLSNLIAMLEKYERQHTYNNIDSVANALIKRYQKNGIVFQPGGSVPWNVHEDKENWKQSIKDKTFTPTQIVPEYTYELREECSLHAMLSHSTDVFPHAGVDRIWDGSSYESNSEDIGGRSRGRGRGRYKRSRSRQRRPKRPMNSPNEMYLQHGRTALSQDIGDTKPAHHPIENGVIYSPMGPLAAGTLLRGIMAKDRTNSITIRTVFGDEVDYMPTEMQNKYLEPVYVDTLSGDIGQAAIASYSSTEKPQHSGIGPKGKFGNCTACPKQFSLAEGYDGQIAQLTRAEIYAGIDALLIRNALNSMSSSSNMQLSAILRMYYSEHGMPGKPDYRACNRMNLWEELDTEKIRDQALSFMYAYSYYWPEIKNIIEQFPDDFGEIERRFQDRLDKAWQDLTQFINNHPDEDYDQCPLYSNNEAKVENNKVDVVIIFGHEGGLTQVDAEKEYITLLAMKLGVSEKRSRLGILDGKNAEWTYPVTNFSNIADWGCNFTQDQGSYGSGFDMKQVLEELTTYYFGYFNDLRSKGEHAKAPSQVIVWNVPSNFDQDDHDLKKAYQQFNNTFRDVYQLFVGKSRGNFEHLMEDSTKDFFQMQGTTSKEMEKLADDIANRIKQVPSVFVYPACDDQNSTWENYNEQGHLYTGYVTPNFTTYMQLSPGNFRFSGTLKLLFGSSDVSVCVSRDMMNPEPTKEDVHCEDAPYDFQFDHLCGRYLSACKPIYLAVFGKGNNVHTCTDPACEFPNQIKFEMRHEGMTCGGLCSLPAPILLLSMLALALLNWS